MKKHTKAFFIFLLFTSTIFAQINFEKGYFISENDQKIECFIKNEGWVNNPNRFEYRISQDSETKVLYPRNFKTIVINNSFKFEKHTVPFDDADRSIAKLDYERSPNFKEIDLVLNVLIEGEATLYSYIDGDKKAFFYKLGDNDIKPLIYKVYTNANNDILYNKRYQQQLLTEFSCTGITEKKVIRVDYDRGDLRSFFKYYNECKGEAVVEFNKPQKGTFHLKVFAGAYNSSAISNLGISAFFANGVETATNWSPTFGIEFEYVFPFNKNKWSAFVAPNYSSYEGEGNFLDLSVRRKYKLEYSAIQVPIGIHHYMFLKNTSKLFLSGAVIVDFLLDAKGSGNVNIEKDRFGANAGFSFGIGYSYNKYSVEARYISDRNLLDNGSASEATLKQFSITIGYTIF
ncbi:hypothetical protein [Kordia sp.]|uniref:hypothetical protein n=1 Tax=Kordia sp. TaxID=1965332 RepID=UPI0025C4F25A|nr:hypothetical protein [Kordia sp.]MCH2196377.1 PorT family protein [Kordia sp.]